MVTTTTCVVCALFAAGTLIQQSETTRVAWVARSASEFSFELTLPPGWKPRQVAEVRADGLQVLSGLSVAGPDKANLRVDIPFCARTEEESSLVKRSFSDFREVAEQKWLEYTKVIQFREWTACLMVRPVSNRAEPSVSYKMAVYVVDDARSCLMMLTVDFADAPTVEALADAERIVRSLVNVGKAWRPPLQIGAVCAQAQGS